MYNAARIGGVGLRLDRVWPTAEETRQSGDEEEVLERLVVGELRVLFRTAVRAASVPGCAEGRGRGRVGGSVGAYRAQHNLLEQLDELVGQVRLVQTRARQYWPPAVLTHARARTEHAGKQSHRQASKQAGEEEKQEEEEEKEEGM
eukprot:745436-Rhodomonas_salina.2